MADSMGDLETISYEQAINMIRRHSDTQVTIVTAPLPGLSFQLTGGLYVHDGEQFAFAVAASEQMSFSVMPFPHFLYQIPPGGESSPPGLLCALPNPEMGEGVMLWMLRFEQ